MEEGEGEKKGDEGERKEEKEDRRVRRRGRRRVTERRSMNLILRGMRNTEVL